MVVAVDQFFFVINQERFHINDSIFSFSLTIIRCSAKYFLHTAIRSVYLTKIVGI